MDFLKIKTIDLYSYEIPLVYPVTIQTHTINKRTGYILQLTTDTGSKGYGDIAPLPGVHHENPHVISHFLSQINTFLIDVPLTADLFLYGFDFMPADLPPTLRFGIESAFLNLIDEELSDPDKKYFFTDLVADVQINALIDPAEGPVTDAVSNAIGAGFSCIKIKTGRQPVESDIRMIRQIDEMTDDSIVIRLDSNRSWPLREAIKLCAEIPLRKIEYLEEPLCDPGDLAELYKLLEVPLAVDESLTEYSSEILLEKDWVNTAVVKPAVYGGVFKTMQLIQNADRLNKKVVISDTYHSGIGAGMMARIAAIRRRHMTAAGLDTYSRLKKDILKEPLKIKSGKINLKDAQGKKCQLNFSSLAKYDPD